jgi:hypothetical protein
MPLLIALLMFLVFAGPYAETIWIQTQNDRVTGEAAAIADNICAYRSYVQQYATANPTFTGPVSTAALALPYWFVVPGNVLNYVRAGSAYVYDTNPPQGLVAAIGTRSSNLVTVGTDSNGTLVGPTIVAGTGTITLPSQIPSGSVVITP